MHGRAAGRPGSAVRPHLSGCLCPGKGLGVGLGGGTWQHLLAAGAGRGQESDRSWILLSAEASRAGIQGLRVCLSATLGEGGVKRRVGRRWAWCSGHVAQCCHLSSASSMDVSTANLSESNASSYTPNRRRPHFCSRRGHSQRNIGNLSIDTLEPRTLALHTAHAVGSRPSARRMAAHACFCVFQLSGPLEAGDPPGLLKQSRRGAYKRMEHSGRYPGIHEVQCC
mmetsp:Transcript_16531/g.46143  ORF Transcript_16531/g.46143 Transcript_16531/m.46143 type:complete len:225 (+) Transcript_16531:866-1540(+)